MYVKMEFPYNLQCKTIKGHSIKSPCDTSHMIKFSFLLLVMYNVLLHILLFSKCLSYCFTVVCYPDGVVTLCVLPVYEYCFIGQVTYSEP